MHHMACLGLRGLEQVFFKLNCFTFGKQTFIRKNLETVPFIIDNN